MILIQHKKYQSSYQQHVTALDRQGKAETTIDVHSQAVRQGTEQTDLRPNTLSQKCRVYHCICK
jgi:integrase/recombinase XerD